MKPDNSRLSWYRFAGKEHGAILRLAIPAIVTNITVPLLGLVDVAIVGHIGDATYIGAIAVGSMIFNVIYWVFGFLRMGTSGMTAQALGAGRRDEALRLLARSLLTAAVVALLILLLQTPLKHLAFQVIGAEESVRGLTDSYFDICVWGAPAMLSLYGLTGWFIGMQDTRTPMVVSIAQNVVNIAVSLVLVVGCGMRIEGVATGTLVAQYAGLAMAVGAWLWRYRHLSRHFEWKGVVVWQQMVRFFRVNSDIFLRTLFLVAVNLYFLSAGARQGALMLAVNTLLMQLFILFSYVMDGFAFAGEALSGLHKGARDAEALRTTIARLFAWGALTVVLFTLLYALGGASFLSLLTSDDVVLNAATDYLPWAIAIPIAGVAAFIWDGVYIGLTATRAMLFASAFAAVAFFVIYLSFHRTMGNHALWLAFIAFLFLRGVAQTLLWHRLSKLT